MFEEDTQSHKTLPRNQGSSLVNLSTKPNALDLRVLALETEIAKLETINETLTTCVAKYESRLTALEAKLDALDYTTFALSAVKDNLETQLGSELKNVQSKTYKKQLHAQINAEKHNQLARLQNSMICSRDKTLTPLRNDKNQKVEGFPANMAALTRLNLAALDTLLTAYGCETEGNRSDKMIRLKDFLGVGLSIDSFVKLEK